MTTPRKYVPRGRPKKYDSRTIPRIVGWLVRDGKTFKQISKILGVSTSTLNEWINTYPELSDVVERNEEFRLHEVEDSAYKRATGYEFTKKQVEVHFVGPEGAENPRRVSKKVNETTVHIPGSPDMIMFLLRTRWKDKYGYTASNAETRGQLIELLERMKTEKVPDA